MSVLWHSFLFSFIYGTDRDGDDGQRLNSYIQMVNTAKLSPPLTQHYPVIIAMAT